MQILQYKLPYLNVSYAKVFDNAERNEIEEAKNRPPVNFYIRKGGLVSANYAVTPRIAKTNGTVMAPAEVTPNRLSILFIILLFITLLKRKGRSVAHRHMASFTSSEESLYSVL